MVRGFVVLFALFVPVSLAAAEGATEKPQTEEAAVKAKLSLPAKNLSIEGLRVEKRARGGYKAHLDGRFRHALVLVIAPDGSRSIECVDSPEREAELLGVMPPAEPEKE